MFKYIENVKINVVKLAFDKGYLNKKKSLILINLIKYNELTCEICKSPFGKHSKKTIDHYIPKSRGGSSYLNNLQLAHGGCNKGKGNKL